MDQFKFEAKELAGSARTVAPVTARKFSLVSDSYPHGTVTAHEDPFFNLESVVASADASFSDLITHRSSASS